MQLSCGGDAGAPLGCAIECRRLMRVLAVAQRLDEMAADGTVGRSGLCELIREPVGDRGVVGAGAGVGLGCELAAQRQRGRTVMLRELGQHDGVVAWFDHHSDVVVILGRRADHGGAADVDILDAGFEIGIARDRGLERVEIDHEEIDRPNAVCAHRGGVIVIVADGEQPAMHLGMQRLDPAVHHFGKAGEIGDVEHGQAGVRQCLARTAGRDQLDSTLGQRSREVHEAGLVGNGKQRAGDAAEMIGHDALAKITADCHVRKRHPVITGGAIRQGFCEISFFWSLDACFAVMSEQYRHNGSCGSSSRGRRGPAAAVPAAACAANAHCTRMILRARP